MYSGLNITWSPRRPCATCLAAACASVLERPTTNDSKVRRGSSGEPPSASCTAEIGAAARGISMPVLISRLSFAAGAISGAFGFGGSGLSTAERTVSSIRVTVDASSCQQASRRSA
jgi:hypothetical protein